MKQSFLTRSTLPEKMDNPDVDVKDVHQALNELENINLLLGGYNVVLNAFNQLNWEGTLKVLDIGSGGGDVLRSIAKWAEANNKEIDLTGIDINQVMTSFAEEKSKSFSNIHFKTLNVWDEEVKNLKPDVTINSLFCHHFDDEELVKLVKRMVDISSKAVIINDLHRHWFAYYSIKAITKIFSRTHLVKYDGPLSVARSLTKSEWETVLTKAGVTNYEIKWMWAWRWQIIINK